MKKNVTYLQECRELLGLTVRQLSVNVNICRNYISDFEIRRKPMSEAQARKFGKFFKKPYKSFMNETVPEVSEPNTETAPSSEGDAQK